MKVHELHDSRVYVNTWITKEIVCQKFCWAKKSFLCWTIFLTKYIYIIYFRIVDFIRMTKRITHVKFVLGQTKFVGGYKFALQKFSPDVFSTIFFYQIVCPWIFLLPYFLLSFLSWWNNFFLNIFFKYILWGLKFSTN